MLLFVHVKLSNGFNVVGSQALLPLIDESTQVDGEQAFLNEPQGKMSQLLAPIPTILTPAPIEDRLDVLDKKEKKNVQPNT